jgi:hypothetical protein
MKAVLLSVIVLGTAVAVSAGCAVAADVGRPVVRREDEAQALKEITAMHIPIEPVTVSALTRRRRLYTSSLLIPSRAFSGIGSRATLTIRTISQTPASTDEQR